jgi:hypothetical protein
MWTARYPAIWNIDQVLSFLEGEGENVSLSFQFLSEKLVFLLAAAGMLRVSDVSSLDFEPISKVQDA